MANAIEQEQHKSLADEALSFYNGESWQRQFIRHNENLTYKVTDDAGKSYLLRLHMPAIRGFEGATQDEAAINSELMWLQALHSDTGLPLQQPIANRLGSLVTHVTDCIADHPIPATLLTWIEGKQVTWQEENLQDIVNRFAEVVSTFHRQARAFQPPAGFTRPAYDKTRMASAVLELAKGVDAGIITSHDFRLFEAACDHIGKVMDDMGRGTDVWGLIHSDWMGNLIQTGGKVVPIDFSLSGFGHYSLDLAICICDMKKPLRPIFIEHFGEEHIQNEMKRIEAFTIYIIVIAASRFLFTNVLGDWYTRRFPVIAQQHCTALQEGRPFLFDI